MEVLYVLLANLWDNIINKCEPNPLFVANKMQIGKEVLWHW